MIRYLIALLLLSFSVASSGTEIKDKSEYRKDKTIEVANRIHDFFATKNNFNGLDDGFLKENEKNFISVNKLNDGYSFYLKVNFEENVNCKNLYKDLITAKLKTNNEKPLFSIINVEGNGILFPSNDVEMSVHEICSKENFLNVNLISDK